MPMTLSNVMAAPVRTLFDGIAKLFGKTIKTKTDAIIDDRRDGELTNRPYTYANPFEALYEQRDNYDRYDVAVGSWKSYLGDARISAGIDGIADDATASDNEGCPYRLNLDIEGEKKKKYIKAFNRIEELDKYLKLGEIAPQIIKRMMLEGSCYREIVANFDTNQIVELKEIAGAKEGYLMQVLLDQETDEISGYALYNAKYSTVVKVFAPWQVISFDWNKFRWYGIPILGPMLVDFERIKKQEISLHIARETRAYLKYAHIYEGTSDRALEQIAAAHEKRKKEYGRGVETDIFSNKDVKLLDPRNTQLANIDDVRYVEKKILTGLKRPKGFYGGFGEDVNRSILEKQEQAYIRFLSKVSTMIGDGYKRIYDLQLILDGISPKDVPISILWTDKRVDNFLTVASGLEIAVNMGLSRRTGLEELGFDPDLEESRRKDEVEEFGSRDPAEQKPQMVDDPPDGPFKAKKNGQAKMTGRERMESFRKIRSRLFSSLNLD